MNRTVQNVGLVLVAMVAGFAVSSPTAAIFNPLERASLTDRDQDRIPDSVERELCGRVLLDTSFKADVLEGRLGKCDQGDWTAPKEVVLAEVPSGVVAGPDEDRDGLPEYVQVTWIRVDVNPFRAEYAKISKPTVKDKLFVDSPQGPASGDDKDPEKPVVSTRTVEQDVPVLIRFGEDKDRDGLAGTIIIDNAKVVVDRRGMPPVSFQKGAETVTPLDAFDEDEQQPVMSRITAPVMVEAYHDGDQDGDLLPHALYLRWYNVTVDRRSDGAVSTMSRSQEDMRVVRIDPDDSSRTEPVNYDLFDRDEDLLPDEVEKVVCMVQNRFDPEDGACVRPDGSGKDGDGDNYVGPAERPNPWDLGPFEISLTA